MDGSAHLFQFQFVWVNNEKSGSVTSRQFGNNALGRGAISRFHESVEEACFEHTPVCVCVWKRERENVGKKERLDRSKRTGCATCNPAWLNNHARLRNSIEWHDFHEPQPLSSNVLERMIDYYAMLDPRETAPAGNKQKWRIIGVYPIFFEFSHSFCSFKIGESWRKERKS